MNANLPQLDLPRDYVVGNDITEAILNFYKQTCRLKAGIFVLCVEGNLRASINLTEYTLKPNDFITLMPGSIIQFCEQKESFRLSFIGFSSEFMDCVNMIKSTMSALPTIYENPVIALNEDRADFINDYFHLLERVQVKTGRSVSDIIADMIIMDAKSQLMATDLTIQEISYSLNFPNVSFFGKYFKRYVGVSPQKFRNS